MRGHVGRHDRTTACDQVVTAFMVPVSHVLLPPGIPAGMNLLKLAALAYASRTGAPDPDPIVIRELYQAERDDRRVFTLTDGRHRFLAAVIAGRESVLAVEEGSPGL